MKCSQCSNRLNLSRVSDRNQFEFINGDITKNNDDFVGQVLVFQDLVGMTDAPPRFAARSADLGNAIKAAGEDWVRRVSERRIGGETYTMKGTAGS